MIEAADSPEPEPRNCSRAGPKSPEDRPPEVVPGLVEFEVAVPRLRPAEW